MDQRTRERALRALAAALLNSGLTAQEIRQVARSVMTDPSMGEQLARLMDTIVENLRPPAGPKRVPLSQNEGTDPDLETFVRAAETAPLSKGDLVRRLQSYAQRPDWTPSVKWSRRRILKEFLSVAPVSSLRPALAALAAGPVKSDPYVDLIMTRGKVGTG